MRRPARIVALFLAVLVLALGAIVWDQTRGAGNGGGTSTNTTDTTDPYGGLK